MTKIFVSPLLCLAFILTLGINVSLLQAQPKKLGILIEDESFIVLKDDVMKALEQAKSLLIEYSDQSVENQIKELKGIFDTLFETITGSDADNDCVDNLTVRGDANVHGNLTVCGKIFPEVAGPQGKEGKRGKTGKTGPAGATGATGATGTFDDSAILSDLTVTSATFLPSVLNAGIIAGVSVVADTATGQLGMLPESIVYKENVRDMNEFSSSIFNLRPIIFNWISDPSYTDTPGIIAEEAAEQFPSLIIRNEADEIVAFKYNQLTLLLLNELIKMHARLAVLEEQISY